MMKKAMVVTAPNVDENTEEEVGEANQETKQPANLKSKAAGMKKKIRSIADLRARAKQMGVK